MNEESAENIAKTNIDAIAENENQQNAENSSRTASTTSLASTCTSQASIPSTTRLKLPGAYTALTTSSTASRIGRLCSHSAPKPSLPNRGKYSNDL